MRPDPSLCFRVVPFGVPELSAHLSANAGVPRGQHTVTEWDCVLMDAKKHGKEKEN